MKKIIFLLSLCGVAQAQIVGGFLPINSTKSFTASSGRFTDNLYVGGTSTLTGRAKQTNTLNLEGNTTWNTNQTNTLTTGNTGTVAVLSDAVFGINCTALSQTPLDATTYYLGINPNLWNATQGAMKVYVPYNCTLVAWTFNAFTNTSVGSAETSTLSLNVDNSATQLSTAITMTAATGVNTFTATGLSTNVNAGSYIEAKLLTPTWVTNPAGVTLGITFWFVRRQ